MELPPSVKRKVADFEQAIDDAVALVESAKAAISVADRRKAELMNRRDASPYEGADDDIAALDDEMDRLRKMLRARVLKRDNDQQVFSQLRGWLARQSATFETVPAPERPDATVEWVRREIAELKMALQVLRAAPLPAAELRAKAREYIDALAQRGRPTLRTEAGAFQIAWRREGSTIPAMTPEDVAATLAWLHHDALLAAVEREIGDTAGVGAVDRVSQEAALLASILEAERVEEGLITADVARRPDASPLAILGIRAA